MDLQVLMQTVPVGGYISVGKVVTLLVISLVWWRLLTWIDKDAPAARLPREMINLGMVGTHLLAWVLVLMLGSFGAYLGMRNAQVGLKDLKAELKGIKLFGGGGKKSADIEEVPGFV